MSVRIYDWAGNHKFQGDVFDTFEDAWDFLYAQVPDADEEDFEDWQVLADEDNYGG